MFDSSVLKLDGNASASIQAFDMDHDGFLSDSERDAVFTANASLISNGSDPLPLADKNWEAVFYDVPELPAFAILIAIWATLSLESWKRREATLAFKWGMVEHERKEATRPACVISRGT